MLEFLRCIFLYCMYSLDSELALTMQKIDVKQEIISQLRAKKKEHKIKLQQTAEEKQFAFDPECT